MKTITFDKSINYNEIDEPLVVVPQSMFRDFVKKVKLTKEDLVESLRDAKEDKKFGRTVLARDFLKTLN